MPLESNLTFLLLEQVLELQLRLVARVVDDLTFLPSLVVHVAAISRLFGLKTTSL